MSSRPPDPDRPTAIAAFRSTGEAEAARSALDAAGIYAYLIDAELVRLNWLYTQAIGGIKVVVRYEDSDRALDVLKGLWPESTEPPATEEMIVAEPAAPPSCPECGSKNAQKLPRVMIFLFVSVVLLGAGVALGHQELFVLAIIVIGVVLMFAPTFRCADCAARW